MFIKTVQAALATGVLLSTNAMASEQVKVFDQDWDNPAHTQITLEPTNVNKVLSGYYSTSKPVKFTREMLWDLEKKKAWDPLTYIPYVVKEGGSWGRKVLENGDITFTRWSLQKQWLTGEYGKVIEKVYLSEKSQMAIFIGIAEAVDDSGVKHIASTSQPLFHVEHGVTGDAEEPLNTWRIVHQTAQKDDALISIFQKRDTTKQLPGYVKVYIQKDLGVDITRK